MNVPKFGTPEWFEWKKQFVAEAYEILLRLPLSQDRKTYDPSFAKQKP